MTGNGKHTTYLWLFNTLYIFICVYIICLLILYIYLDIVHGILDMAYGMTRDLEK